MEWIKKLSKSRLYRMKKWWICLIVSTSLYANESALYQQAQELLGHIRSSSYSYTFHIDEAEGIYDTTCSSFMNFLIQKVSLPAYQALLADSKRKQPLARNYYAFFNALKEGKEEEHWKNIRYLKDVQVGDIIAWEYDISLGKKDSGHVVMVDEKPIQEADGRYRIRILDSSKGTHAEDTRFSHPQGGIGKGVMWFVPDENGEVKGFYWSDKSKKMSQHALSIGRLIL